MSRLPRVTLAALTAASALMLGAGSVAAIDDAKPTPCTDPAFKDPKGDAAGEFGKAPDNLDITQGFFRTDAKGTTANIQVANLSKDVPADATAVVWRILWSSNETDYYAHAIVYADGSEFYEYGSIVDLEATSLPVPAGEVEGKLFEGPDGIVQLQIPADLAKAGTKFATPNAFAARGRIVPGANRGVNSLQDVAPDGLAGKAYTVAPCPAPPVPTTSGPAVLSVKLASSSVKAPKGKSLSLKLKSSEEITGLKARLRKGTKRIGKGSLARLSGSAKLKLRLSNKLRKGSYVLDLTGSTASGQSGTTSLKLNVK